MVLGDSFAVFVIVFHEQHGICICAQSRSAVLCAWNKYGVKQYRATVGRIAPELVK
jgi:hypothetical protein